MAPRIHGEIRPADLLERYHVTRHHVGFDSCVVLAAQYHSPSPGTLTPSILFPALAHLIHTHAALGVHLTGDQTHNPIFSRLPSIDLSLIVHFIEDEPEPQTLRRIAEDQLAKGFDTSSTVLPLWRLVVLKRCGTVVFAYHHGIGDGMSGVAFHRCLLEALNANHISDSDDTTIIHVPTNITLIPPVESLTPTSPSLKTVLGTLFSLYAPKSWTRGASSWTGNPVAFNGTLKVNVRFLEFSVSEIKRFKKMCRDHGATITSAFHELAVSVLAELVMGRQGSESARPRKGEEERRSKGYKWISTAIPISLRSFTRTSPDAMCVEVSTFHTYTPFRSSLPFRLSSPIPDFQIHEAPESLSNDNPTPKPPSQISPSPPSSNPSFATFWASATSLTSSIRSTRSKCREQVGLLKFLFGDFEGFFKGKMGKKREVGFVISNLGSFFPPSRLESPTRSFSPGDTQPGPSWEIRSIHFAQCDTIAGSAMKLNVVGDGEGGVCVGVTWGEGAIDDGLGEFVSGFREGFMRVLEEEGNN
ncbi:hypothetical protein JAAARDRAFT_54731 [Jaapia argillacea MUCL 33604]|uniref:Alcohol acetyltransferase n=1 Tax=Jaapia argillacea MUCL 33604 TaxID=933084 RepID=A0A067QCW7_9AGAM|nr:hypothetical protein JAAARDRAFT_54731 [Jaapia argillacea MUCL 33604]